MNRSSFIIAKCAQDFSQNDLGSQCSFCPIVCRLYARIDDKREPVVKPVIDFSDESLHKALKELYESLTNALERNPPPDIRIELWQSARETLRHWIQKEYLEVKVLKLIGKISNGFDYWFTFIINPDVEPTNNRAERALRPQVILRKILGTLRNDKGTSIHERIMTTLTTWEQRGLDGLKMLTATLAC